MSVFNKGTTHCAICLTTGSHVGVVQMGVDNTRREKLRITVNVTFPSLPCQGGHAVNGYLAAPTTASAVYLVRVWLCVPFSAQL